MRLTAIFTLAATLSFAALSSEVAQAQDLPSASSDLASASNGMTPQVAFVANSLRADGNETLLMLDKKNGELLIIDQGQIVNRTPALYGRGQGEDETIDADVTPAGVFTAVETNADPAQYQGGRVLAFLCTSRYCYSVHPTWQGRPSERRDQRLETASADDNATSLGCINVSAPWFTNEMMPFLNLRATVVQTPSGPRSKLPTFVVLPLDQNLDATARILGLKNPNSALPVISSTPSPN